VREAESLPTLGTALALVRHWIQRLADPPFADLSPASAYLNHPNPGWEWDWLVADDTDCVALFSTAGFATAPPAVVDSDTADDAVTAIFSRPSTNGQVASEGMTRGIYDWRDWPHGVSTCTTGNTGMART